MTSVLPEGPLETKQLILNAAREVSMEKGLDGARMQEIADRAGINKALLHYHFTSKEKLFDEIFNEAFSQFSPQIKNEMMGASSFQEFLKLFIRLYINMLIKRPYLPIFILNELQRNPDRIESLLKQSGINPETIRMMIQKEMDAGRMVRMNPGEVIINILSLCIFPFASRPMMQRVFWNNDIVAFDEFLENRVDTVYRFVARALFNEGDTSIKTQDTRHKI